MKDFKHGSNFDRHESGGFRKKGFNKFDNRRGFGGSSFDKPSYPATCAECGERCEVPFKPVNGRPVFCKNCFRHDEGRADFSQREERHGFERREERPTQNRQFTAPAQDYKRDFLELNRKLDEVMAAIREMKVQHSSATTKSVDAEEQVEEAEETEAEKEAPKKKKAAKSKEKATKKKK